MANDLPTGQPSFGVALQAIGSPSAPSPFVDAATGPRAQLGAARSLTGVRQRVRDCLCSSHLHWFRLFYEANRRPRLATLPENRPRRDLVAPVCAAYCSRVLEVWPARDEADEEASLAIHNQVWPHDAVTMAEVRSFSGRAIAYGDHLALIDGEPVGSVAVAIMPSRPAIGFTLLAVLPRHRRRGAGSQLYRTASAWIADHDVDEMEGVVPEDDDDSLAWAVRRGFRELERNSRLVLDVTTIDAPPVDAPPGVEIVTWAERPELAGGIYDVACEAYPDIPGWRDMTMEPRDDWIAHRLERSEDRPEATFVAVAGDEVVGYAKFTFTDARPKDAEHDLTGVKRAWRGRGVAGALKRAQVAWAKREGYERLQTQNEVRNKPIRRLNQQLGYRVEPGRVIVRGPPASAQAGAHPRR